MRLQQRFLSCPLIPASFLTGQGSSEQKISGEAPLLAFFSEVALCPVCLPRGREMTRKGPVLREIPPMVFQHPSNVVPRDSFTKYGGLVRIFSPAVLENSEMFLLVLFLK